MTIITSPDRIQTARLLAMRGALKLEMAGMKRKGKSIYAMLKSEFGWTGGREKILAKLNEELSKRLQEEESQE